MHPPWRLKVGIALGGGAARGLAHVGVLRGLVREGIPIDVVTGTSMGAVVGGSFAACGDIAAVEARVRSLLASEEFRRTRLAFLKETKHSRGSLLFSVTNLVRRGVLYGASTLAGSFLSAEEFVRSLAMILPDIDVSETPIRFAASAVDLEGAVEVVLGSGNLREVAAASSAIPGLLPPRRLHGRLLVDGGWVDKIPILPAFRLGADVVIGVDISADMEEARTYRHGIDVVIRANLIKDAALTTLHRRLADVILTPDVGKIHWADFESADYCIDAGDRSVANAAAEIRELLRLERVRSMVRPGMGKRMAERYLAGADLRFVLE